MDGFAGLAFTWDPRTRTWVKERGPEDAASPFVPPVDAGAVQTYFLDTYNGRWTPTVLGVRARQITAELGGRYRAPTTQALAYVRMDARPAHGHPGIAVVALIVILALVVVALAAQLVLGGAPRALDLSLPR